MIWTTRNHLHLDRTASAWLIRKFVDPDAEFSFVDWSHVPEPAAPRTFGMPGIPLSGHDAQGTCFAKILRQNGLDSDPALVKLERGIAAGVRQALGIARPENETDDEAAIGSTLDRIGAGLGILHNDDDHLAAATPIYDALHTFFRLGDVTVLELPGTQPERVNFLRELLGVAPTRTH
jgi:hypothetical protein